MPAVQQRNHVWQSNDAKTHFSELLTRAEDEGPQRITRHGREFVLMTIEEHDRRLSRAGKPLTLHDLFAPIRGVEWEFTREKSPVRDVEL